MAPTAVPGGGRSLPSFKVAVGGYYTNLKIRSIFLTMTEKIF
jgi:hypothetical protein